VEVRPDDVDGEVPEYERELDGGRTTPEEVPVPRLTPRLGDTSVGGRDRLTNGFL
jgi:hypothetical protein